MASPTSLGTCHHTLYQPCCRTLIKPKVLGMTLMLVVGALWIQSTKQLRFQLYLPPLPDFSRPLG
ncbi:Hypothetical protein FKW44_000363 [Caligus rogercresseyi]|uniref:Uncharacterized protein n=1 Tax=Caligus rogercresseyi TaxID=217165 RepID=A0A7T8QUU8_CALRO|nr:Hypothetical protein FKW44_000363 [Caligus rogercresseyi]